MIGRSMMIGGWAKVVAGVAIFAAGAGAQAAIINYGSFIGDDVTFLGVTESSGTDAVPLFDTPSVVSNALDFDPKSFVSFATNGNADVTDGQLNFDIVAHAGKSITGVSISELGDYTLMVTGTPATSASAGVIAYVKIVEINNVPLPVNQIITLPASSASVAYFLPANSGSAKPWGLGLSVDIAGALQPTEHATRVQVVLNNTLATTSEPSTLAFIAKKDFVVDTQTNGIPEPSSLALLGGLGLLLIRKRTAD